jgi:hypothetical protein
MLLSRLCLAVVLSCCLYSASDAAPAPAPPPGPREIDFSTIKGNREGRYKVTITVTAGKSKYSQTYDMDGGSAGVAFRDFVFANMKHSGWDVELMEGAKLKILGKDKQEVKTCTLKSDQLAAAELPIVSPVNK